MSKSCCKCGYHIGWYRFMWWLARPYAKRVVRKRYQSISIKYSPEVKGPCLILSNHTSADDSWIVGQSIKPMFFTVMGEFLYRSKLFKPFVFKVYPLIAKKRCASDYGATKKILTLLTHGQCVLVFPEGDVTKSGETMPFGNALIRIAKKAGVSVVTYRIQGGAIARPSWNRERVGGHVEAGVVHVYSAEDVASLSVDELYARVKDDLYQNDIDEQKKQKLPVTSASENGLLGKFENNFYICPNCKGIQTIYTKNNSISCTKCGPLATLDGYGLLKKESENFQLDDTVEWWYFQESVIADIVRKSRQDELLLADDVYELTKVLPNHKTEPVAKGKLLLYANRFELVTDTAQVVPFHFKDMQTACAVLSNEGELEFGSLKNECFELRAQKGCKVSNYLFMMMLIRAFLKA